MSSPESFKNLVSSLDSLKQLTEHIRHLTQLENLLLPLLSKDIRPYIRLANLRDRCLVIEADSSVWATRVRHQIPEILEVVNHHSKFPPIESIRIIKRTKPATRM